MVLFQEFDELLVDGFLEDFGREGEQGDQAITFEIAGVSGGFLYEGFDICVFPSFREGCCGDGGVEDVGELSTDWIRC